MIKLFLLITHTISDFCLQTGKVAASKSDLKWKGLLIHGAHLLVTSSLIFFFIRFDWELARCIAIIVITHLAIDSLKVIVNKHTKPPWTKLLSFIVDQVLHISIIMLLTNNMSFEFTEINRMLARAIGSPITEANLKALFIILYIALSGAYLIPLLFNVVYSKVDNYFTKLSDQLKLNVNVNSHVFFDNVNVGKWVGILERVIIGYFILLGQFGAIGFTIAVKSLARFKMMDNKIFSEYYLLGTLFSVTYTFIAFAILQKII